MNETWKMFALAGLYVLSIVVVVIVVLLLPAPAEAQSCYAIGYMEARKGDTWRAIANHFGMSVSTLKAMNPTVRASFWGVIPVGTSIKVALWVGNECYQPQQYGGGIW